MSRTFRRTTETQKANRKRFKNKNCKKEEEIKDIQNKIRFLTANIEYLNKYADKYAHETAKVKDIQLLQQSKDLQLRQKKRKWMKAFLLEKRISRKL